MISCRGCSIAPGGGCSGISCRGCSGISCRGCSAISCRGCSGISCRGYSGISCRGCSVAPCCGHLRISVLRCASALGILNRCLDKARDIQSRPNFQHRRRDLAILRISGQFSVLLHLMVYGCSRIVVLEAIQRIFASVHTLVAAIYFGFGVGLTLFILLSSTGHILVESLIAFHVSILSAIYLMLFLILVLTLPAAVPGHTPTCRSKYNPRMGRRSNPGACNLPALSLSTS